MISGHDHECLAVLRAELDTLTGALAAGDGLAVRVRLATMAQQIHVLQLTHDPLAQACAEVTHVNGLLLPRYTAGVDDRG